MRRESTLVAIKATFLFIGIAFALLYAGAGLFSLIQLSEAQSSDIKNNVSLHLQADNNTEVEVFEPVSVFLGKGAVRVEARYLNLQCSRVRREFVVRWLVAVQQWTITPSKVISVTPDANCVAKKQMESGVKKQAQ